MQNPWCRDEHGLMHKSKMNARFVAADRTVECRVTMEEVDRKPELIAIELGCYPDVRHKHHWYPLASVRRWFLTA